MEEMVLLSKTSDGPIACVSTISKAAAYIPNGTQRQDYCRCDGENAWDTATAVGLLERQNTDHPSLMV